MTSTSRKVKTVLIVGDFAAMISGQAKVAIDSAVLLADAGIEVVFFAASGPVAAELAHPNIRVICLDQATILDNPSRIRAAVSGIWNHAAARALRDVSATLDPATTVLHCHGYAKALSPAIGPVLANGPLRSVFTLHEYFLACPNGGFFDYRRNEICTRPALGLSCLTTNCDARRAAHKAWRVARSAVSLWPGRLPSGLRDLICISDTQARIMAPYLPSGAKVHRVSNPVSGAGPAVNAPANNRYVFVGRLSPEKGAVMFAEAARDLGLEAVFVGEGPEADAIRRANPDARLTGWVSPAEVQAELEAARAMVFPSVWYECQPLATIEALLRGVPVVTGRWCAAAETITDGVNGALYAEPSIDALKGALRRVPGIGKFDTTDLAAMTDPATHRDRLIEIYDGMLTRSDAPG